MPSGGRRILSRIQTPSFMTSVHKGAAVNNGAEERDNVIPLASMVVLPRHAHLPEIPGDGNLFFEATLYLFGLLVMGLQYVHMYKTVWWLPHSHATYALNFYLIDVHLVTFLVVLLSYRLVCCIVQDIYGFKSTQKTVIYWLAQFVKVALIGCLFLALGWSVYNVLRTHAPLYCLYLCYPAATYFILFGPTVRPLFHKNLVWPSPVIERLSAKPRSKEYQDTPLHHTCTLMPDVVRDEVDSLKSDFNNRVKQVLFNATVTAYYMAFVPLCFAQNTLYYNTLLVTQHVCMAWMTAFLMLISHFLPPKYIDLLHRCALHLGRWQKVEGRHAHVPYNAWSELQVWPNGALVKHVRGLFKADGVNVTAEPGNTMHARFYLLFHAPTRVLNWLLSLCWVLVGYQFVSLLQSSEWSHILSISLMLFTNYYLLFRLMRDRIILSKVYKDDEVTVPPTTNVAGQ